MVGPDANRFVFLTGREHFSHNLGWTPVVGQTLGHGLLNMDPPEHTRHRALMNPAFTTNFMAAYLPLMQRIIAERTATWLEQAEIDLRGGVRNPTGEQFRHGQACLASRIQPTSRTQSGRSWSRCCRRLNVLGVPEPTFGRWSTPSAT
jgi:hypothetical protein